MGEQQLITLIVAMFASTGFWAFVRTIYEHQCEKKKEEKHKVSYELVNDLRNAYNDIFAWNQLCTARNANT